MITPPPPRPADASVTRLLQEWTRGDPEAMDAVLPHLVEELRRTARRLMRGEAADHTLQPTALVHELYLRLRGRESVSWQSRAQFFGFAAEAMRRILVDHARARERRKRGGGWVRVDLAGTSAEVDRGGLPDAELMALDRALERLAALDERQCRVVELRYFLGLTVEQVAEALELSVPTVYRDWALARAWLYRELRGDSDSR